MALKDENESDIQSGDAEFDPAFEYFEVVRQMADENERVNSATETYDPLDNERGATLHTSLGLHNAAQQHQPRRSTHGHAAHKIPMREEFVQNRVGYRFNSSGNSGRKY